MIALTDSQDSVTPVRIIYERTTSGAIAAETAERIGASIAALAQIIQASRPCQIIVVSSSHGAATGAASVRINLNPHASAAEIGLFVASLGVIRRGCYAVAEKEYGFNGGWPFGASDAASESCVEDIRTDDDIYIPPVHVHNPLAKDPGGWCAAQLARVFGTGETE